MRSPSFLCPCSAGGPRGCDVAFWEFSNFCSNLIFVLQFLLNIYKYLIVNLIINLSEIATETYKFQVLYQPLHVVSCKMNLITKIFYYETKLGQKLVVDKIGDWYEIIKDLKSYHIIISFTLKFNIPRTPKIDSFIHIIPNLRLLFSTHIKMNSTQIKTDSPYII